MSEKTVTVLTAHNQVSGVGAKGPWTVHKFESNDGRSFDTFDQRVANQAHPLLNQPVEVEFETEKKGEFTNYKLLSAVTTNATPSAVAPVAPDQRQTQIMRQSASKVASYIVGWLPEGHADKTLDSVILVSEQLLKYYTEGPKTTAKEDGIPF